MTRNRESEYLSCPVCPGKMAPTAKLCWKCWARARASMKKKIEKRFCPNCREEMNQTSKVCYPCYIKKSSNPPIERFCKKGHDTHETGRQGDRSCVMCRKNNRKNQRLSKYGMTSNDYNLMFNNQGGRCAVCKRHQTELPTVLHIDHDHVSGKVRGLLCSVCNAHVINVVENFGHLIDPAREYLKCREILFSDNGNKPDLKG